MEQLQQTGMLVLETGLEDQSKFANNRGQAKTFNSPYDSKSIQERRKRIYDVASVGDKTEQ